MYIASAYPDSAISAGSMVAIALVMVISLALWLILVFRADKSSTRASGHLTVAQPEATAEDKHSDIGHVPAGRQHGAAA